MNLPPSALGRRLDGSAKLTRTFWWTCLIAVLSGIGATLVLGPADHWRYVVVLWGMYTVATLGVVLAPSHWRNYALLINGAILITALLGSPWLQGWGLAGGSLYFLPMVLLVFGMTLPLRQASILWMQASVGLLALTDWHTAELAQQGIAATSIEPSIALRAGLLIAACTTGFAMGGVLGHRVQRQMAREAEHKARYRDFFQQVPTGVIVHRGGIILDANQAAADLLGYPNREALAGVHVRAVAADEPSATQIDVRLRRLEQLEPGQQLPPARLRLRSLSGRQLDCQATASRVQLPDGPATIAMLTDETLRIAMEASLRWSLSLQQQLVASSPLAIGITHINSGRTINTNEAAAQLTGYSVAELVSWDQDGMDRLWPDVEQVREINRDLRQSGISAGREVMLRTRAGSARKVRIWASSFEVDDDDYAVWFIQDVTEEEQQRAERIAAIEQARSEAEAASRSKSAFLANTSHELRTPLNAVIGLSHLALASGATEKQRMAYLRQIHESSKALSNIVSDVLDLSKIEAGGLVLEHVQFDLDELITQLEVTYQILAEGKGLRFESDRSGPTLGWVEGDPTRVRQIAQNLLSNALKFTEEGVIRFTVKRLNTTHVCLEVTDTGPGVPLEVQTQIFEPFAQADSSTTRRYGGTGLGLAIVREICELMDGHCDVSSETGRGSRFWCVVSLPSTTAHPPQAPVAQKAPEVLPLQDRKVMVAEDNPVNRMIITLMLEQQGAKVVTVNDGRQLLKVLDERLTGGMLPDAILMDMQMPGMDGKEATRAVRQHTGLRHIPIIALTAGVTSEEREDALTSGVDDYLVKPIDPELLCRALQRRMRDT